jgi:ankyrin repeat protein
MKINNVFLVSALVCSLMVQSLLFSVEVAAVVPAGVEETKDVAVMAPEQEGPSAKITLLRDQMAGEHVTNPQATLLHGAMLWELGIIKGLYILLVTPKSEPAAPLIDGHPVGGHPEVPGRTVADSGICPLGVVLKELFHLAGETLAPTKTVTSYAWFLKPTTLGSLYKNIIDKVSPPLSEVQNVDKKIRPQKNSPHHDEYFKRDALRSSSKALVAALTLCISPDSAINPPDLNPPNLLPCIIASFFWAKYIQGIGMKDSVTMAQARKNLKEFNEAAGMVIGATGGAKAPDSHGAGAGAGCAAGAGAGDDDDDDAKTIDYATLEEEVINRIQAYYSYNLPKPPVQGTVEINGKSVPDCGESSMRGLFCAAFYNSEGNFVVPEKPDAFYDSRLVEYFKNYPNLTSHSTQKARQSWAEVISGRHEAAGVMYADDGDINCGLSNIACLIKSLVPGLETCCDDMLGAGAGAGAGTRIYRHFQGSPNCSEKILKAFATAHCLAVDGFVNDKEKARWHITKKIPGLQDNCSLAFKTNPGHMDCNLLSVAVNNRRPQLEDPILLGSDAIDTYPPQPDAMFPIIFAAARMAQQQDFLGAYLAMMPIADSIVEDIRGNVEFWGFLRPEDARILDGECNSTTNKMFKAVKIGLKKTVTHLVEGGADVKAADSYGSTALMYAARNGYLDIVKLLLEKGADLNAVSKYGSTVLKYAAWYGHLEVARFLVENGADVDQADELGQTTLMCAANNGYLDIVKLLVEKKANLNAVNTHGQTALIYAASTLMCAPNNGRLEIVKLLVNSGAKLDAVNNFGDTALMSAAQNGYFDIVKLLLEKGADVNAVNKDGKTAWMIALTDEIRTYLAEKVAETNALTRAAEGGHLNLVRFLVNRGADVNAVDQSGMTALMHAAERGHFEIVELLVKHRADVNAVNKDGKTAWMIACNDDISTYLAKNVDKTNVLTRAAKGGHLGLVRFLVQNGADVKAVDNFGMTALMHAAERGHLGVVEFLLEKNPDLDKVDTTNVLTRAAEGGHLDLVRFLVQNGADVKAVDNFGMTALMCAAERGHLDVVKLLVQHRADVNAVNKDGKTAWMIASTDEIRTYLAEKMARAAFLRRLATWMHRIPIT